MAQLREMVFAMALEISVEKAKSAMLQATVDAWENHEDPGGDADREGSARASVAPAPGHPHVHSYIGSPGEHDQHAPGRHIRFTDSQGEWQAREVDEEANGQTQDRRGQDPWMPAVPRYPVSSWDHSEPPQMPPGMTTSATSGQWTERPEAREEWCGPNNSGWKNQWQDWNRDANSYGWSSSNAYGWNDSGPKYSLDKKDIEKPEKYTGEITKWVQWSNTIKRYLKLRCDSRWPQILKHIELKKGQTISKEDEDNLAYEFNQWSLQVWKEQLFQCLEMYTAGEAKKLILNFDENNVLSAWSRLADQGHSLRDPHLMDMRRKVYASKTSVSTKDLENSIAAWEKEVLQFEEATDSTFEPHLRMLLLMDMCPPVLKKRIQDFGPERFSTYAAIKAEVLNWLADNNQPKGKLAAITDAPEVEVPEIAYDDFGTFLQSPASADWSSDQLLAMVRNSHLKKTKGAGKGSGKDRPPRKCYECDSPDHIATNCPQRAARVAAGGPERLDDPMGLKGGKAKGKTGKKGKIDKGGGKG